VGRGRVKPTTDRSTVIACMSENFGELVFRFSGLHKASHKPHLPEAGFWFYRAADSEYVSR